MSALDPVPRAEISLPHLATTPVTFRHLLAAVDFSAQTPEVLHTAAQIARLYGADLFLVNAATPSVYGPGAEPIPIETFEVNIEAAQTRMNALIASEPGVAEVKHQEIVAYASALELVQRVVEEKDIDLVIAGSHSATGMERLALGSVAECILRTVRCPVMVIGPQCKPQKDLFASILLATRLTPSGLRSAQYASALAAHAHGRLTLLHVVEPSKRSEPDELLHDHLLEELDELVPGDGSLTNAVVERVEYGKAWDLILSVALCTRTTLIVMGAHEDGPLADHSPLSTVAEVIHNTTCPVLTVRGHFR